MPRILARCVRGLEWVSAEEADARLGARAVVLGQREVAFDIPELNEDLLGLRTVDDILLALDGFDGVDHTKAALDELARGLAHVKFRRAVEQLRLLRELPAHPTFDVVAALTGKRNYNRYAVEDVAGEVAAALIGARYVSRNPLRGDGAQDVPPPGPCDLTVRLFLSGQDVQVALRLPARPPHRRAWKQLTGPGTLHPPLAAGLVRIAGVQRGESVADPFCGDGTIAIEAALAAGTGAGPGPEPSGRILAADLDPGRLVNAELNAEAAGVAGVAGALSLVQADAGRPVWRAGSLDAVITNPPWNRSVGAAGSVEQSMDAFWDALRGALSERGRVCLVADAELDAQQQARHHGFEIALAQTVRLAGRLSVVLLASPPGARRVWLPQGLAQWRANAVADGVVSAQGF